MKNDYPDELKMVDLREVPVPTPKTQFGNWHYVKSTNVLQFMRPAGESWAAYAAYEIDLDRMKTAAQCLDWIFQIQAKRWATAQDQADLLEAIRRIVRPQERLCSFELSRKRP